MLLGVVSDIHGNVAALEAACRVLRARGAEQLVCCGDIVGYGASVREVLALMRREGFVSVKGNHDDMATRRAWPADRPMMAVPLAFAAETLDAGDLAWLAALPVILDRGSIRILHGMPSEPLTGYLYPHIAADVVLDAGVEMLLVGHSHNQFHIGRIANPGTCGQGRDGDPRTACMLFDEATLVSTPLRIAYDPSPVAAANAAAGFDPVLNDHLFAGRRLPSRTRLSARLYDAAAIIEQEGIVRNVVRNTAGVVISRDDTPSVAAFGVELEDGSILIRSTPVAYSWEPGTPPEPPPGFTLAENRAASFHERRFAADDRADAGALAETLLQAMGVQG
jgi:predicted phosphodiesterase